MIELGLSRIARLLKDSPLPWRAIHVAGTNGKGSVCAYTSAMLHANNIKCGRFTSPHLMDRWDCITIDEKVVDQHIFNASEELVRTRDRANDVRASEFELLTATAFEVFNRTAVEVGVVEVGLGGKDDATNILRDPLAVVITKIGIDHQSLLGHTLAEIAHHKAGIIKKNVHSFVDGSNSLAVLNVIEAQAKQIAAGPLLLVPQGIAGEARESLWSRLAKDGYEEHQQMHIELAYEAVRHVIRHTRGCQESVDLTKAIENTTWPGRLQAVDMEVLTGHARPLLVDGAHNAQSARVLGYYVDHRFRAASPTVTWIVGFSQGKDLRSLLACLLKPGDNIIATDFSTVKGMPWVKSAEVSDILQEARSLVCLKNAMSIIGDIGEAIRLANELSNGGQVVVAGSLYLVADLFRLLRSLTKFNPLEAQTSSLLSIE